MVPPWLTPRSIFVILIIDSISILDISSILVIVIIALIIDLFRVSVLALGSTIDLTSPSCNFVLVIHFILFLLVGYVIVFILTCDLLLQVYLWLRLLFCCYAL
jgi:hypothetical protein